MSELIELVKEKYPKDTFFKSVAETLKVCAQARAFYRAYDKAFDCLDDKSWIILSRKAVEHFCDHRSGQLKQGFFNQLNEAFAYQFLLRQGYTDVSVLEENGRTTPDLTYRDGISVRYCEVKSIGISDEQIRRWLAVEVFDGSTYRMLSPEFMEKLDAVLEKANCQIKSKDAEGAVFIVLRFDDFTLSYYKRYRKQIVQHLSKWKGSEVYIKVGLFGSRRIHKRASNSDVPTNLHNCGLT